MKLHIENIQQMQTYLAKHLLQFGRCHIMCKISDKASILVSSGAKVQWFADWFTIIEKMILW